MVAKADDDAGDGTFKRTPREFGHDDLGTLHRAGACWQNDRAKVCAWKVGEPRYFVDADIPDTARRTTEAEYNRWALSKEPTVTPALLAAADSDPTQAPPLSMSEAHRIFLSVGIQSQTNLFCRNGNPIHLADYPLDPNVIDFEDAHHDLAHKGSNTIL